MNRELKRMIRLISSPRVMAYHMRRMTIDAWMRRIKYALNFGNAHYPQNILILPTTRCNLNCMSCNIGVSHSEKSFAPTFERKNELTITQWRAVIDKVSKFRPMISISGGEPFLYPDILALLSYIKQKKLYCSLTTNATLLKESDITTLIDNGLDMLTISFDGIGDLHDQARGVSGTFKRAITNLDKIIAYRKQQGRHFPVLHINSVMSPLNQSGLVEMADFFAAYDIDSLNFSHIWSYNQEMINTHNKIYADTPFAIRETLGGKFGQKKEEERNLKELWDNILLIKKRHKQPAISFLPDLENFEELLTYYDAPMTPIGNYRKCYAPWNTMEVYSNGDVEFSGACFHMFLGNLVEQNFDDVWNGEELRLIRAKLKKVEAFPICTRCCYIFQQL